MKWTFVKPTQSGYFWMRDRRRGFVEEVVEIESVPKMGLVSQKELCVDGVIVASSPKTVEWAGPIAPPQEPQS